MADRSRALAEEVGAFIDAIWSPDLTVRAWWRALFDHGFAHPTWPEGVGGRGATPDEARTIRRALVDRRVVGPPVGHLGATLAAPTILEHGTPEQIQELVAPIALGEAAWCQLFSEPGAGSDLAGVTTSAVADGAGWVVNGQKVWNSAADQGDLGMLLARTDATSSKHAGLTYFVIDMHQPGVTVRPVRMMDGSGGFCEVFLDDARVSPAGVIGTVGGGWAVAQTTMRNERSNLTGGGGTLVTPRSGSTGDLDAPVGQVLDRAQAAAQRRSPIPAGAVPSPVMIDLARRYGRSSDPVTRQALARYVSQVRVNSWTIRRMARPGGLTGADGSIAKLTTSRVCQASRELSYRLAGADLLLSGPESPLAGRLQVVNLASPGTRIGGGTDEIQLNVLAERGLGLPREPATEPTTTRR